MKNEAANQPLSHFQIMDETEQKPKCTIFPSSFGGEEVQISYLFCTNIEDNLTEYLILPT